MRANDDDDDSYFNENNTQHVTETPVSDKKKANCIFGTSMEGDANGKTSASGYTSIFGTSVEGYTDCQTHVFNRDTGYESQGNTSADLLYENESKLSPSGFTNVACLRWPGSYVGGGNSWGGATVRLLSQKIRHLSNMLEKVISEQNKLEKDRLECYKVIGCENTDFNSTSLSWLLQSKLDNLTKELGDAKNLADGCRKNNVNLNKQIAQLKHELEKHILRKNIEMEKEATDETLSKRNDSLIHEKATLSSQLNYWRHRCEVLEKARRLGYYYVSWLDGLRPSGLQAPVNTDPITRSLTMVAEPDLVVMRDGSISALPRISPHASTIHRQKSSVTGNSNGVKMDNQAHTKVYNEPIPPTNASYDNKNAQRKKLPPSLRSNSSPNGKNVRRANTEPFIPSSVYQQKFTESVNTASNKMSSHFENRQVSDSNKEIGTQTENIRPKSVTFENEVSRCNCTGCCCRKKEDK